MMAGTSPSGREFSVFIAYSRKDAAMADAIVDALVAEGFETKIDRRSLPYGQKWQEELSELIWTSDTVVWLVSSASIASKWCKWELGEAGRLKKRLIPLAIQQVDPDVLPPGLSEIHLLPSDGIFSLAEHRPALIQALKRDGRWLREATRLADRARQWIEQERSGALLLRSSALRMAEAWLARQPDAAPLPSGELLEMILASKQAAVWRLRWTLASVTLIAFVGIALAVLASIQQRKAEIASQEAKTQSIRATRAVELAGSTASALVSDLATDFRDRGVPLAVTRRILERAQKVMDDLAEGGEGSPKLIIDRAAALTELSATYLGSRLEEEASRAATAALSILVSVSDRAGSLEPERLTRLSRAYAALGDAMMAGRQFARARDLYRQSIDVEKDESKRQSSYNQMVMFKLATSLEGLGDRVGAEENYRGAIKLEDERSAREGTSQFSEVSLITRGALADLIAEERVDDALGIYREIKEALQRWVTEDKEVVEREARRATEANLATVLNRIGNAYLKKKDFDPALGAFRQALDVSKSLADKDPDRDDFQYNAVLAYYRYAKALSSARQLTQAISIFQLARNLAEQNLKKAGSKHEWLILIPQIVGDLGDVFQLDGTWSRAAGQYRTAVKLLQDALKDDAENVELLTALAHYHLRLNDVEPNSREHLRDAADVLRRVDRQGQLIAEDRRTLDAIDNDLGKTDPAPAALSDASVMEDLHRAIKVAEAANDILGANQARAQYAEGMVEMLSGMETYRFGKPAAMSAEMRDVHAWYLLLTGNTASALSASDKAISTAPHLIRFKATKVLALLILGRSSEAHELIRANRGARIDHASSWNGQIHVAEDGSKLFRNLARELDAEAKWEQLLLHMLAELRSAGVALSLLQDTERMMLAE